MITLRSFMILVAFLILSGSCTSLKRYSSVEEPGINNEIAGIDLFGLNLTAPEPSMNRKSLWDLSADAQSQLIKILNARYTENAMFLSSLDNEYLRTGDQFMYDDYSKKDLRLIFSVSKLRKYADRDHLPGIELSPADRLEYLRITLRLPENSVLSFRNWNKYATEYGSIELADVSFNRTLQLGSSGAFSADKPAGGFDISSDGALSLSRKEDQSLKYRYLVLNGKMNNREIEMEEEGTREIDLAGNITVDLSLGLNTFPETLTSFSGLRDEKGGISRPDAILVSYPLVSVPKMISIKDTLRAELEMDFVYRNVVKGSKTFPEWDDRVKYYTGKVKKRIPLFTEKDYIPDLYCIGIDGTERDLLKIKSPDNYLYALKFRSFEEASDFNSWLMQTSLNGNDTEGISIGGQTLVFKDNNLTYSQIKGGPRFKVLSYYQ